MEVDVLGIVVVQQIVDLSVVFERHGDATEFETLNEFFELDVSVKVDVEISECSSIVFELLLKAEVDLSKKALHMILLHKHLVLMCRDLGYLEIRWILLWSLYKQLFINRLVVFKALNIMSVVIILQIISITLVSLCL